MLHIVNEEIKTFLGQLERIDPQNKVLRTAQIKHQNKLAKRRKNRKSVHGSIISSHSRTTH